MKNPLIVITVVIVAVLLVFTGIEYFINAPEVTELPTEPVLPAESAEPEIPDSGSVVTPPSSPAVPDAVEEQLPVTFAEKINKLNATIKEVSSSREPRRITLLFSELEANEQAARMLAETEMPADIPLEVKGVNIDFQPGNIVLTEFDTVVLEVFSARIKVKSVVSILDGKPDVIVTDVNFGFVKLPSSLKDKISGFVKQAIEDLLAKFTEMEAGADITIEFTGIDIQEESVTLEIMIAPVT